MFHIIQNAIGKEYKKQLETTSKWHQEYCDTHKYTYHSLEVDIKEDLNKHWTKIPAILSVLEKCEDGDSFLWLDCDSVIKKCQKDFELDKVLEKEYDLGLVERLDQTFNTGVIFGRKNDAVISFFNKAMKEGPLKEQKYPGEQIKLNSLLSDIKLQTLPSIYNSYPAVEKGKEQVVIRSFHGVLNKEDLSALLWKAMLFSSF